MMYANDFRVRHILEFNKFENRHLPLCNQYNWIQSKVRWHRLCEKCEHILDNRKLETYKRTNPEAAAKLEKQLRFKRAKWVPVIEHETYFLEDYYYV